ncbi:MAG: c-type cytochrome [Capsulimonadaceae bacterium]
MKLVPILTCSAVFAATIALAGITAAAPGKHMSAADKAQYAAGKALVAQNHCNGCHGATLAGQGAAPSLLPSGSMKHYTSASFTTLMNTDVAYNGKKLSLPMAGKLATKDIKAIYVYLHNQ